MPVRHDAARRDHAQVLAVVALAVALRALQQPLPRDPAVLVADLLGHGDGQVLGLLDRAHELGGREERLHGAGVEPRVAAAERHHVEGAVLKVHAVEVGDLVLAARGRAHASGELRHALVVEVQPRDGVAALGVRGLLLDGDRVVVRVELHDAEALRVVHAVAEDRRAARLGVRLRAAQVPGEAVAVEDVVAEHQGAGAVRHEGRADHEGLREPVGLGLLGVGQRDAEVRPVAQEPLEVGEVGGGRDDQDVPDSRQHEGGERVVDHGLVVDGQELLARHGGERVQARSAASRQDDALHAEPPGDACRAARAPCRLTMLPSGGPPGATRRPYPENQRVSARSVD